MGADAQKRAKRPRIPGPDSALVEFLEVIPQGKAVDVGCGTGRNGLFLARKGFEVTCVDTSGAKLKRCGEFAEQLGVSIECQRMDVREFAAAAGSLSCVVSVNVLTFLKMSEAEGVVGRLKKWLCEGGIAYVSEFTTEDSMYRRLKESGADEVEPYSFVNPRGKGHICFFPKGHLRDLFRDFSVLRYSEGATEIHGAVNIVAQKPESGS
jgi:tellurite methyltransferase